MHVSDDGTVNLEWEGEGLSYQLEQSTDPGFSPAHERYAGTDTASVLTGLGEGRYYFRVRETSATGDPGDWSEPLALEVRYMDSRTLFLLLGTGAFVATLTIAAIIRGFLKVR